MNMRNDLIGVTKISDNDSDILNLSWKKKSTSLIDENLRVTSLSSFL